MLYTLGKRGPLLENGSDPYDVYAGSHQILAVCRSLALGCTRRCLARNRALHVGIGVIHAGVGLKRSVLVVHAGVGLKMSVLGCRCRRWAIRVGVGSQILALDSRRRGWLYTLALGSIRRWRFVDAVGSC